MKSTRVVTSLVVLTAVVCSFNSCATTLLMPMAGHNSMSFPIPGTSTPLNSSTTSLSLKATPVLEAVGDDYSISGMVTAANVFSTAIGSDYAYIFGISGSGYGGLNYLSRSKIDPSLTGTVAVSSVGFVGALRNGFVFDQQNGRLYVGVDINVDKELGSFSEFRRGFNTSGESNVTQSPKTSYRNGSPNSTSASTRIVVSHNEPLNRLSDLGFGCGVGVVFVDFPVHHWNEGFFDLFFQYSSGKIWTLISIESLGGIYPYLPVNTGIGVTLGTQL